MTSDDLTAAAAIALGAFLSVAVTARVVSVEPSPIAFRAPAPIPRPTPFVDYAIIRGPSEIMVGPEGPHSGWAPQAVPESPLR